jgi:hypothetical protein
MSKGGVEESPQEAAMREHAVNLMQDYKLRWLPVQQKLIGDIKAEGAEGSVARKMAAGKASTDAAIAAEQTQGAVEKSLTNMGAGPASSRFKLGLGDIEENAAHGSAMGGLIADEQITDAYTRGLGAITALGRGEREQVGTGMEKQAAMGAQQAQETAQVQSQQAAGVAGLLGSAAGYGLQQGIGALMKPSTAPTGGTGTITAPAGVWDAGSTPKVPGLSTPSFDPWSSSAPAPTGGLKIKGGW